MIFNMTGGKATPDGNDIEYPISQLPTGDKAYLESSIQDISLAIQIQTHTSDKFKVSEMAEAIRQMGGGMHTVNIEPIIVEYTVIT